MIAVQVRGTKPIEYQWFKDDKELGDGDDYKGSTTPKLVIVGTGLQVKGKYVCQVKNKFGKTHSQGMQYGKLYTSAIIIIAFHNSKVISYSQIHLSEN